MSASFQLPKPEQMIDIVSNAAAVKLAMDGKFDARIAELKEAIAALDEKTSIAQTLEQAQKIKDDADTYAAAALEKEKSALTKAQDATDKAASREATVSAREQAVASREAGVQARQQTQDIREQSMLDTSVSVADKLAARESALVKNEADYAARKKQLDADIRAFNQRLEALKA